MYLEINNNLKSSARLPTLVHKKITQRFKQTLYIFKSIQRFINRYFYILKSTLKSSSNDHPLQCISLKCHFECQDKESHCFQWPHLELIKPLHSLSLDVLLDTNRMWQLNLVFFLLFYKQIHFNFKILSKTLWQISGHLPKVSKLLFLESFQTQTLRSLKTHATSSVRVDHMKLPIPDNSWPTIMAISYGSK